MSKKKTLFGIYSEANGALTHFAQGDHGLPDLPINNGALGAVSSVNTRIGDVIIGAADLADISAYMLTVLIAVNAAAARTTLGIGSAALIDLDTDGTLAANSDTRVASQKATRTYVTAAIAALLDSTPATLDTLNELAAALGDDANFAATMATALGLKLNASAVSAFMLTLLDDADQAAARATLGLTDAAINTLIAAHAQPYDMPLFYPDLPGANAVFYRGRVARALAMAANMAASDSDASAAATASTTVNIKKNGTTVATAIWGIGATQATLATTAGAAQNWADGDLLEVVGPALWDATLANPSLTLVFTR